MPIYSFSCKKCGANFDTLVDALSDSKKQKCEKCGSKDISRTFSGFTVSSSSKDGTGFDNACGMNRHSQGCCPGCKKH